MAEYRASAVALFQGPASSPAVVSIGVGKAGDKVLSIQNVTTGAVVPQGYFGSFLPADGQIAGVASGSLAGQYLVLLGTLVG